MSWDEIFSTPQAVKEAAIFWVNHIDRFNGCNWWPKRVEMRASVDASGVGFGGSIRVGAEHPVQFMGTFPADQATESSTAREIRGYAAALTVAAQQFPQRLRGTSILLEGNNQGAISALNHFRSPNPGINQTLQRVFQLCCNMQFDVVAKWILRDNLTEADELSRRPDPFDWGLAKLEFERTCGLFGVRPSVDLSASDVHHVSDAVVSQFYTPGCMAVDAFRHDWGALLSPSDLAWIFPPIKSVILAISLVQAYTQNALICLPI